MEFEILPAILAGMAGGIAMSAMMRIAKAAGLTEMDMALIEGAMFTDDRNKAKGIGAFVHVVMMSGMLIGSIYAQLFSVLAVAPGDAWWVGAAFGVAHGVIAGVGFAMIPAIHPRMGRTAAAHGPHHLHLQPLGPFGKNYGAMTPAGVVMAHVIYGLVVGLVYAWLV